MPVRLLITRPEPAASRLAEALRRAMPEVGIHVSPLMRIVHGGTLPPLSGDEVLILTSRHGVEGLCRLTPRRDLRAYAVGEATAAAARCHGFAAVAAGGDAAALLELLERDGVTGPFLHPRGEHVAADIAGALRARGHTASEVVVYDQRPQPLDATARALLAGDAPVVVPLMSPRSAALFFEAAGTIRAPLHVAAISAAAARGVPEGAARAVSVAESPDAAAMCRLLQDLVGRAKRVERSGRAQ